MKTTPLKVTLAKLVLSFCGAVLAFDHRVAAAPGDLDLTFGGTGKVTTDFGGYGDEGSSVAIQSDGKIVVAGPDGSNSDFAVARYNPNGSLDRSFNGTGKVTTDFAGRNGIAWSVAIQSDGKIVVAGSSSTPGDWPDFTLVRYNTNGTLDTSFNGTGKVITDFNSYSDEGRSVAIQSDGKIMVAGFAYRSRYPWFAVARYNSNGSLDTSFNGTGKVTTGFREDGLSSYDEGRCVALQADGKIIVAGNSGAVGSAQRERVARYNPNGSLDTSFNGTGKVVVNLASSAVTSMALQDDGKIVCAGVTGYPQDFQDFLVVRLNSNGSLDANFANGGWVSTDIGRGLDTSSSVVVQSNGRILVAGSSIDYYGGGGTRFALVRYNAAGDLDTSFNGTGKVTTDIGPNDGEGRGVALQSDGKIVVAGVSWGDGATGFAVARYEAFNLAISEPQTLNLGATATFNVIGTDIVPLSYQWKKDGVAIPGATASSYTIPNVQPWHIGDYSVVATHSGGTATSGVALLEINGVPTPVWRGLVAYYPFDGNAMDREAGGANAAVTGAVLTADRLHQPNRAFDFDGIDDKLSATVPNLPAGSAPRTLSFWAKARPDPNRPVGVVEWGFPVDGGAFGVANSGSPYTWFGKTYGAANGVNSGVVVDSKWHQVCLTYDDGALAIYLDGTLKQTKTETINTESGALTMGVGVEGSTFYPGSLDEIRIYNRALSAADIQQLNALEDPDTDGDGIRDQFETGTGIYVSPEDTGTSATNRDSDGDGLPDGQEVNTYLSNPNVTDTDGDGFDDGFEVSTGFSPTSAANTPDALSSIRTAVEYRFNAANGISYRIEASTDLLNWTTIETPIIGPGGMVTRFYSTEGQPKRFFRSRRN